MPQCFLETGDAVGMRWPGLNPSPSPTSPREQTPHLLSLFDLSTREQDRRIDEGERQDGELWSQHAHWPVQALPLACGRLISAGSVTLHCPFHTCVIVVYSAHPIVCCKEQWGVQGAEKARAL